MKRKILWIGLILLFALLSLKVYTYYYWPFWKPLPHLFSIDDSVKETPIDPEVLARNPGLPPTVPPDPSKAFQRNSDFGEYLTRNWRREELIKKLTWW